MSGGGAPWPSRATLVRLAVIAVPLFFAWEMLQAPWFAGLSPSWRGHVAVCALATVGDLAIVTAIAIAGAVASGDARWYAPPTAARYVAVLLAGVAVQVVVELIAVHALGLWAYAPGHPRFPFVDVGLLPVLAAGLLPLILGLLAAWEARLTAQRNPGDSARRPRW